MPEDIISKNYNGINVALQHLNGIVTLGGTIGNILAFFVFRRDQDLKTHSLRSNFKALTISNVILLILSMKNWLQYLFDIEMESPNLCQIEIYLVHVASCVSMWILALNSLSLAFSKRYRIINTTWFQYCILVVLIAYSLLVYIRLLLDSAEPNSVCYVSLRMFNEAATIYLVNFVLANLLINNICGVMLIRTRKREIDGNSNVNEDETKRIDDKFMFITCGLNITSLVCNFPLFIVLLLFELGVFSFSPRHFQALLWVSISISLLDNAALLAVYQGMIYFAKRFMKRYSPVPNLITS